MYMIVVGASKIGEQIAASESGETQCCWGWEDEDRATKVSEKLNVSVTKLLFWQETYYW